jgi:hypothetical protein
MQFLSFCVWLISLNISASFIHAAENYSKYGMYLALKGREFYHCFLSSRELFQEGFAFWEDEGERAEIWRLHSLEDHLPLR